MLVPMKHVHFEKNYHKVRAYRVILVQGHGSNYLLWWPQFLLSFTARIQQSNLIDVIGTPLYIFLFTTSEKNVKLNDIPFYHRVARL